MSHDSDKALEDLVDRVETRVLELMKESVAQDRERRDSLDSDRIAEDATRVAYEEFQTELEEHPHVAKFYRPSMEESDPKEDTETRIKALYTAINAINFRIGFQSGIEEKSGCSGLFAKLESAKAVLELMVDEIRRKRNDPESRH